MRFPCARAAGLALLTTTLALIAGLGSTCQEIHIPSLEAPADPEPWLDNPVHDLIQSGWFETYRYGDCPADSCGVWPELFVDCFLPDRTGGPSEEDRETVPDPPGLYYKHLTPRDVLRTGESLMVGVEGGTCGTRLRSLSLMVHPQTERRIVDDVGVTARVEQFYAPFVEGAVGREVPTEVVETLYRAALYQCGANNGGDTRGQGARVDLGPFVAVVQWWDGMADCNVHVVRTRAPDLYLPLVLAGG